MRKRSPLSCVQYKNCTTACADAAVLGSASIKMNVVRVMGQASGEGRFIRLVASLPVLYMPEAKTAARKEASEAFTYAVSVPLRRLTLLRRCCTTLSKDA